MPDSTKELLSAHHAAVLRELNQMQSNISNSLSDIKEDMGGIRERMNAHSEEDHHRFSALTNDIGILKWAYGAGLIIVGAIFSLLKLGVL